MNTYSLKDIVLVIIFTIVAVCGIASMYFPCYCHILSWLAILSTDLYLFCVLLFAAIRADDEAFTTNHPCVKCLFPQRTTGLFIFVLLLIAIVCGFAGLYVGTDVFQSGKTPLDAFYTSLFIMGFNDPSPPLDYGKIVVIAQFASGILLLIGVFPLLVSRISNYNYEEKK